MLWTLITVLILLWLLSVVVKFKAGGLIHLLLFGAGMLMVYRWLA